MYHRILPSDIASELNEEAGMYVTPETFSDHLEWLNEIMTAVKLSEWVSEDNPSSNKPGNYFAITFDDGWQDNYQYALPILKKHNISATVFLVSNLMGTSKLFWPNRLAQITELLADFKNQTPALVTLRDKLNIKADTDYSNVSEIIAQAKEHSDADLNLWLDEVEQQLSLTNGTRQLLNWEEIQEMLDSDLIEFGAHTKHHTRLLDTVSNSIIDDEVVGCKEIIEKQLNNKIELFCYPNGDYSDYSAKQVSAYYKAAVTTQKGINQLDQDLHKLMRVGVHQDISETRTDFLAHISCWR